MSGRGMMKKITALSVIVLMMLILASCGEKKGIYRGPEKRSGAFDLVMEKEKNPEKAMVSHWYWDGDTNNTTINVPDESEDGIRITAIGGASKSFSMGGKPVIPFKVYVEDDKYVKGDEDKVYTTRQIVFTIHFGKNIESMEFETGDSFYLVNYDGTYVFYMKSYYFICDPENPYYYTKDGKVYDKKTNNLTEEIPSSCYGEI